MASDASHMLEAALEQMDDIIAGSKAAAEYTNGLFELGSPGSAGPLQVLQLVEDLRLALELQPREEERDTLRAQVPNSTAHMLMDWLDMDRYSERVSEAHLGLRKCCIFPLLLPTMLINHYLCQPSQVVVTYANHIKQPLPSPTIFSNHRHLPLSNNIYLCIGYKQII
ncbi:unnamed protein product [Oncorhynchus mykiss]|uniref:Uncharacterized protein n=1 Tax=Oncorhynchus mykiss TaxID=8022 RepID=A0A060WAL3_ONCMY|nr:unnamed protein product [Oncorhynchus mykiss]